MDFIAAVDLINGNNKKKIAIGNLMHQIIYLMRKFEVMEVIHTYRKSNGCAHLLVNHGKQLKGGCEFFLIFLIG